MRPLTLVALAALLLAPPGVHATQAPCQDDARRLCANIKGPQRRACLLEHRADVSPACRDFLDGNPTRQVPTGAPGMTPFGFGALAGRGWHQTCQTDIEKLCATSKPRRQLSCLREHKTLVSSECGAALDRFGDRLGTACKSDVGRWCDKVSTGQGRRLACLREHEAELSAECRRAVEEARTRPAPGGQAPGTLSAPATSLAGTCEADVTRFCEDAVAACLAIHKTGLAPGCQQALDAPAQQMKRLRTACAAEVTKHCAAAKDDTELASCLAQHEKDLAPPCRAAQPKPPTVTPAATPLAAAAK